MSSGGAEETEGVADKTWGVGIIEWLTKNGDGKNRIGNKTQDSVNRRSGLQDNRNADKIREVTQMTHETLREETHKIDNRDKTQYNHVRQNL